MEDTRTMQVLHLQKKGPQFSTMVRYFAHKEATSDNQLNEKYTIYPNIIFDTILKTENL
jgi:hypothetical protein